MTSLFTAAPSYCSRFGAAVVLGLTYAVYAHRGAYPLIVTALLAAGFVLAALRPGSATSADSLIRRLVYAWVAQN